MNAMLKVSRYFIVVAVFGCIVMFGAVTPLAIAAHGQVNWVAVQLITVVTGRSSRITPLRRHLTLHGLELVAGNR